MAKRHRQISPTRSSARKEPKTEREAEHRRLRRNVHQELHMALAADPDEVVFHEPHHTHGYLDPTEREAPPTPGPRRVRHWKQKFWKRRTASRRVRAQLATEID